LVPDTVFQSSITLLEKNVSEFQVSQQCCGSGMFIPDPGSWFLPIPDPGSRIPDPRSQIPDPKTATK
jgi:hypothetical protein